MAVNSYNPWLGYSHAMPSSSSENDVDEVFLKQGPGSSVHPIKGRSVSDPVYANGKDSKKEDLKYGKTPALSDSSNVVKNKGENELSAHGKSSDLKAECSTIFEELNSTAPPGHGSSSSSDKSDTVFPEPESMRERVKDVRDISLEDQEGEISDIFGGQTTFGLGHTLAMDRLEDDDLNVAGDVFESGDVLLGAEGNEGDDDDNYPEIEHFPSGYSSRLYDDAPMTSDFTHDTTRLVLPSYDNEKFPDLPDDLNLGHTYSYFSEYECGFSPAKMPDVIPFIPSPKVEAMLKEDW